MTEKFAVLDLETQRSAEEVGGWHKAYKMGISCCVIYNSVTKCFDVFRDLDIEGMIEAVKGVDLVVGFNIRKFDYVVLSGYSAFQFKALPTLDLIETVKETMGYHIGLNDLAAATLGTGKSADGLQALKWWKEGKISPIIEYCKQDVAVTRDLYLFGRENGFIYFENLAGQKMKLPVDWK